VRLSEPQEQDQLSSTTVQPPTQDEEQLPQDDDIDQG
jgi:hypothetical protein